jgi:hypothetical protein
MKYLLVVGFSCEVYRKEPRARIYVGDKLIDEFLISHHKDTFIDAKKNFLQLQPLPSDKFNNMMIRNLPPLRFYEIEIPKKYNQLKLRIDVDNDDSNSTNGFITKSTLLKLQSLYFFPYNKKILLYLDKIKTKNRIGKNYAWYRRQKCCIFDIADNTKYYRISKESISLFPAEKIKTHDIGGSGYFDCELVKKYGIFIPQLIKSRRFILGLPLLNYLYDKYEEYAN